MGYAIKDLKEQGLKNKQSIYPVMLKKQSSLNFKLIITSIVNKIKAGKPIRFRGRTITTNLPDYIYIQAKWLYDSYVYSLKQYTFTRVKYDQINIILENDNIPEKVKEVILEIVKDYSVSDIILNEDFIHIFFPQVIYKNERLYIYPLIQLNDEETFDLFNLIFINKTYRLFKFDVNGALIRSLIEYFYKDKVYKAFKINTNDDIYWQLMKLCRRVYRRDEFKKALISTIYARDISLYETFFKREPQLESLWEALIKNIVKSNLTNKDINKIMSEYITNKLIPLFENDDIYMLYINNDGGVGICVNQQLDLDMFYDNGLVIEVNT